MTEPYSPTARAKASAIPASHAGKSCGKNHPPKRVKWRCSQARGRLLQIAIQILQYGLNRANDKRQTYENQHDRNCANCAILAGDPQSVHQPTDRENEKTIKTQSPEPARIGIKIAKSDPRDGGGKGEGEIDHRIQDTAPWEAVSNQDPGNQQAEDAVYDRREHRRAEGKFVSRDDQWIAHCRPEIRPSE